MTPSLLRITPAAPEDERAFEAWAIALIGQLAIVGALLMIGATAGWWPIDRWVIPGDGPRDAFAAMRTRALVVEVLTLALFAGLAPVRRAALVTGPIAYALLLFAFGWSLGEAGPVAIPWLADAMIGVVPTALMPLRLARRAVVTPLIAAALGAGFVLARPDNLRAPGTSAQLSFLVFDVLLTMFAGELLYRVLRNAFVQQRVLERATTRLAEVRDSLAGLVAERTRELRSLARHLDDVQEAERRRIAGDLHDDLGQQLTAMRYTLARIDDRLSRRPEEAQELLAELGLLLDATTVSMRGIVSELRPRVLDDLGLVAAADWVCERVRSTGGAVCTLVVDPAFPAGREPPAPEIALALFRVLQEGTTNALKHAGPAPIEITLAVEDGRYVAVVRDHGAGFDPTAATSGFGLLGLRERVRACGGELEVVSAPGQGTRLTAVLPPGEVPAEAATDERE